ncbi:MAG: efflux RND transporter periplasmic adaptor subunit [Candidatus Rokuibacteriota bacterium]|nr:MAG: efflux RND transporter periplasmic adaptor subunit [Candidatus Rokubacteria bacterium]PYN54145.1 MAG: efflux RND transporter periplasmic adaptor subunit [Candidatus Rokubacteria bacterium]
MTEPVRGPDLSGLKIDARARRIPANRRWVVLSAGLVALLLVAGGLYAFLREAVAEVEVATVRADKGGRPTLLNASGYVTPRQRATIAAKITARVNEIFVDEGMSVEPGQVLAKLDDSDARARLASAHADQNATAATVGDLRVNLENAEREARRIEELWERRLVAEQARDQARMAVDSLRARIVLAREQVAAAAARVKIAQQDLDNCTVRAPFGGIVVSKDAQRGEMVSPVSAGGGFTRTGIATIVDMASLEIEVDVNESYIARVKAGQPVTAVLDAYPDWQISGKVRTVIPTADRQKATVKVRAAFDKLDPRILPDMGVKLTFLGDERAAPTAAGRVLVPRTAVREEGGGAAVFVHREGRLERRAVKLGQARGNEHEVLAGLSDGDQVVTAGINELRDGQNVRVKR